MLDPRPLYCSSLTTALGGTKDTNLLIPITLPWHESRSYVERFNSESLRVDIPDEKFSITAFIVGFKDLMFSILKNPQASMAKVLANAEKYINGKEARISKWGSSSTQKKKSNKEKKWDRRLRRQRDQDRSPRRN